MGDFIGFSFNGYHSQDLGIVRVSDGDRYKEDLLPDFDDATIDIPGGDGTYYFGSYYKTKKFTINIAFDSLTETQYRNLRRIFSTRKPSILIFDEAPYKAYNVKVEGPPSIEAICFDERKKIVGSERDGVRVAQRTSNSAALGTATIGAAATGAGEDIPISDAIIREQVTPYINTNETERIYKGEGEISLVAYDPFAYAPYKDLQSYRDIQNYEKYYNNIDEWKDAAGLKESLDGYDVFAYDEDENASIINVFNPGDMPAPFQLYIGFGYGNTVDSFSMTLEVKDSEGNYTALENKTLSLDTLNQVTSADDGFIINTKNHLIEGVKRIVDGDGNVSYKTTGTLYNQYVLGGDFFTIPQGDKLNPFDGRIIMNLNYDPNYVSIIYNYIYF